MAFFSLTEQFQSNLQLSLAVIFGHLAICNFTKDCQLERNWVYHRSLVMDFWSILFAMLCVRVFVWQDQCAVQRRAKQLTELGQDRVCREN